MIGTLLYRKKYENSGLPRGTVVAAEADLILARMLGTEVQKESVLPTLLEGDPELAFPDLMQRRVYADFRNPDSYFIATLYLILTLFKIHPQHPVAIELRESLTLATAR